MRLITLLLATCLAVACGDDKAPEPDLGVDTAVVIEDGAITTEDSTVNEDGTTEDSGTEDGSTVEDSAFID